MQPTKDDSRLSDKAPARRVTVPNTVPEHPAFPAGQRVTTPNATPAQRVTTPNAAPAQRVTTPNAAPAQRVTTPAPREVPAAPAQLVGISNLQPDMVIHGDITIIAPLQSGTQGGESVMYRCRVADHRGECVIKLYHRTMDEAEYEAKQKIIDALSEVSCVAPVLRSGRYSGYYYEVMPRYQHGSLADRLREQTFSEHEIRTRVLPRLNRAIHAIHQAGVVHGDIKPANVLYTNDGKDFVLIDFGVAIMADSRGFMTSAGRTMDYSAPELRYNKVAMESDYYSLGITLYELFVGKTPTAFDADKEVDFRLHMENGGRIRKPKGMSDNFYALLLQLTYQFVQQDQLSTEFPLHTRWGYEQVCGWLSVKEIPQAILRQIVYQSEAAPAPSGPVLMFAYNNSICNSINELILAMADSDIDTAYRYVMAEQDSFSAMLESGVHHRNPQTREALLALRRRYAAFKKNMPQSLPKQEKLFLFYYAFSENLELLFLPEGEPCRPGGLPALGERLLDTPRQQEDRMVEVWHPLLSHGILKSYLMQRDPQKLTPVEMRLNTRVDELTDIARTNQKTAVYALGYLLAGHKPYVWDGIRLSSITDLCAQLTDLESDPQALIGMVGKLVKDAHHLQERFAGWLLHQGVSFTQLSM